MPQALVVSGLSPAFCCRLDSMFPAEKHKVPHRARPRPSKVCGLAVCPTSSGQNNRPRPSKPKAPPISTLRAIFWPKNTRAFSAFHSVAVENTTATRPLGIHWLAVRKHMKLTQNRHNPCARQIRCPRRFITCRRRLSNRITNSTSAAKPKR
ncbi:hypothetical protein D3C73_1030010 [compost metagenome]